jgi:hypothetical protein
MCLNCDRKDYLYMLQTHSQCRLKKLIIYRSQMHQGGKDFVAHSYHFYEKGKLSFIFFL